MRRGTRWKQSLGKAVVFVNRREERMVKSEATEPGREKGSRLKRWAGYAGPLGALGS